MWTFIPDHSKKTIIFGKLCCDVHQVEEKQRASQQFSKLQAAMKVLGVASDEQRAFWLVLGAIYHLGAAGATKGTFPEIHCKIRPFLLTFWA